MDQDSLLVNLPNGQVTLDILVENMGRVNFGPNLLKNKKEPKFCILKNYFFSNIINSPL